MWLEQFVDLRAAWQERVGCVFEREGGWYANAHYLNKCCSSSVTILKIKLKNEIRN